MIMKKSILAIMRNSLDRRLMNGYSTAIEQLRDDGSMILSASDSKKPVADSIWTYLIDLQRAHDQGDNEFLGYLLNWKNYNRALKGKYTEQMVLKD